LTLIPEPKRRKQNVQACAKEDSYNTKRDLSAGAKILELALLIFLTSAEQNYRKWFREGSAKK